jgi:hypothetical protein
MSFPNASTSPTAFWRVGNLAITRYFSGFPLKTCLPDGRQAGMTNDGG